MTHRGLGGDSSVLKHRVCNRKVAGSIPELTMGRCVLGKDVSRLFLTAARAVYSLWWPNLTKNLQTEPKKALRVDEVRQAQSAWFISTNEHTTAGVR